MKLEEILRQPECKTLEYKRDLSSPAPALDRAEDRIVRFIREGNGRSTAEIATQARLSTRATQHRLAALAERGFIVVVGSGPRDPRRRWFAAGEETHP